MQREVSSLDYNLCDFSKVSRDIGVYTISYKLNGIEYYLYEYDGQAPGNPGVVIYASDTSPHPRLFYINNLIDEGGGTFSFNILSRTNQKIFYKSTNKVPFNNVSFIETQEKNNQEFRFVCEPAATPGAFTLKYRDKQEKKDYLMFGWIMSPALAPDQKSLDDFNKGNGPITREFFFTSITTGVYTTPTPNINFCRGDAVSMFTKDSKYYCSYNPERVTQEFLEEYERKGWPAPAWSRPDLTDFCSRGDLDPFRLKMCDAAADAKDKFCLQSPDHFFSNSCVDYITKEPARDKTRIRKVFGDQLDKWCAAPPTNAPSQLERTCQCIMPSDKIQKVTENLEKTFENPLALASYVGQPLRCWYLPCSTEYQDIPMLKDYSDCTSNIVCIENIEIDSAGDISKVDVSQSENCSKTFKKKDAGGGGGGKPRPAGIRPVVWIGVGAAVIVLIFIILIILSRRMK